MSNKPTVIVTFPGMGVKECMDSTLCKGLRMVDLTSLSAAPLLMALGCGQKGIIFADGDTHVLDIVKGMEIPYFVVSPYRDAPSKEVQRKRLVPGISEEEFEKLWALWGKVLRMADVAPHRKLFLSDMGLTDAIRPLILWKSYGFSEQDWDKYGWECRFNVVAGGEPFVEMSARRLGIINGERERQEEPPLDEEVPLSKFAEVVRNWVSRDMEVKYKDKVDEVLSKMEGKLGLIMAGKPYKECENIRNYTLRRVEECFETLLDCTGDVKEFVDSFHAYGGGSTEENNSPNNKEMKDTVIIMTSPVGTGKRAFTEKARLAGLTIVEPTVEFLDETSAQECKANAVANILKGYGGILGSVMYHIATSPDAKLREDMIALLDLPKDMSDDDKLTLQAATAGLPELKYVEPTKR